MSDYPQYLLNLIFANDPNNGISSKQDAPTADPRTMGIIEQEARTAVKEKKGKVIVINGSHSELMQGGSAEIDAFLSHNDEANDNFPVINIVLRGR
jgi:hypothetical protein